MRRMLLIMAIFMTAVIARAEVPNRSIESMTQQAGLIVTGAVTDIHVSKQGRSETRLYTIRVHECKKGGVKPGDSVIVRTWHTSQLPGTVGSNGHRGCPTIGQTTSVYAGSERTKASEPPSNAETNPVREVILPNGFVAVAPIFAREDLLKPGTPVAQIDEAADKALALGAWVECEQLCRAALGQEATPVRREKLLRSLAGQLKYKDMLKEAEADLDRIHDRGSEAYQNAWRTCFYAAGNAEDEAALVRIITRYGKDVNTGEAWKQASFMLSFLDGEEAKAARAQARKNAKAKGADPDDSDR